MNLLYAASGGRAPADVPLRGELRHGLELARLLASREFLLARRAVATPPVLLIPGFIAGDPSLSVLRGWLARRDLRAPLEPAVEATSIYCRSDGIVSWDACLDPCARLVQVDSSHVGMAVNRDVYRLLAEILEEYRWTG